RASRDGTERSWFALEPSLDNNSRYSCLRSTTLRRCSVAGSNESGSNQIEDGDVVRIGLPISIEESGTDPITPYKSSDNARRRYAVGFAILPLARSSTTSTAPQIRPS